MDSIEAILYIHGSHCTIKNMAIDQLGRDLVSANTFANVEVSDKTDKETGESIKKVKVIYHDSQKVKEFYIFEVFWGDLKKTFNEERPIQRFFKSTSLVFYWLFSGIWKAILSTPKMSIPFLFSMFLVFGWYFSSILILADGLKNHLGDNQPLISFLNCVTSWKNWAFWGILTLLLTVLPTDKIINMAHFSRNYLKDKSLRSQIRERIINAMNKVSNDERFDSVQILAHSFGSILATEFLSYENMTLGNKKMRVVTLGASLGFILNRSGEIKEILFRAQKNPKINRWQDYFSYKDWLCSVTPKDPYSEVFESIELKHPVSIENQLNGESHQMYFLEEEVLKEILLQ